jgi:hypothetical protein
VCQGDPRPVTESWADIVVSLLYDIGKFGVCIGRIMVNVMCCTLNYAIDAANDFRVSYP